VPSPPATFKLAPMLETLHRNANKNQLIKNWNCMPSVVVDGVGIWFALPVQWYVCMKVVCIKKYTNTHVYLYISNSNFPSFPARQATRSLQIHGWLFIFILLFRNYCPRIQWIHLQFTFSIWLFQVGCVFFHFAKSQLTKTYRIPLFIMNRNEPTWRVSSGNWELQVDSKVRSLSGIECTGRNNVMSDGIGLPSNSFLLSHLNNLDTPFRTIVR